MLIFAGDNEIFYKDIVSYVENLKEDGVDIKLVVGEGMFHVYPLFPSPEARAAFKIIKEEFDDWNIKKLDLTKKNKKE